MDHKKRDEIFLYILIHINFKLLIQILMFTLSNESNADANKIFFIMFNNSKFH